MRVIVVGASGYIGRALFRLASKLTDTIGTSTGGENGFLRLRLDECESFDYGIIKNADVVFITAAISSPDVCSKKYDDAWKVNVTGTSVFIDKAIQEGAKVIFFSSDIVYGEHKEEFEEGAICKPTGDYAIMKHEVEKMFIGNASFKVIRLSYVFSREDRFTQYLCECANRHVEAEVFHPFYRAIIHRDDVVEGAISLAQRWNEFPHPVINFGGPNVLARKEFAQTLKDCVVPSLQYRIVEPDMKFFLNRPRVIQMKSPLLRQILGRTAHSLKEAAKVEFDRKESI